MLERDSVSITLRMKNGSVGTIHYMANGDTSVSKEYVEVFGGQQTAILENFRSLTLHKGNKASTHKLVNQAKGHSEEIEAFVRAVSNGTAMPIDYETLIAVTQTTFLIHTSLDVGAPVDFVSPVSAARGPENLA